MKKSIKILSALVFLVALLPSCRSTQKVADSYSYYDFGTTLVNASPSGEITIKSWGSGPDKATAIEEAMKNAVNDVIFKGFPTSKSYMAKPIVTEVNARERYAQYFDAFFAKGGEYRKFVREASNSDASRVQSKSNGRENYSVTVVVDRNALQSQLRNDGVIK